MPPASSAELIALARLLDDPAPEVRAAVRARLDAFGPDVLGPLRAALHGLPNVDRTAAEEALHDHHIDRIATRWHEIVTAPKSGPRALERGAFLLASYRYPSLDTTRYTERLDLLAAYARPEVERHEGADRALALARFLRHDLGFRGNRDDYYDPRNSYLNWVLDHRLGIPISLSIVYLLIGRRLGLPVYGVNMPAHFLVKYRDGDDELYLDPYNGAHPLARDAAIEFLLRAGIRPRQSYFRAARVAPMLYRLVRNLVAIAEETDQPRMIADLGRLLSPVDADVR